MREDLRVNGCAVLTISVFTDGAVCANCRPRLGELYQKQVGSLSSRPATNSDWEFIPSRLRSRLRFKWISHDYGRNVSGVKDRYIRWVAVESRRERL